MYHHQQQVCCLVVLVQLYCIFSCIFFYNENPDFSNCRYCRYRLILCRSLNNLHTLTCICFFLFSYSTSGKCIIIFVCGYTSSYVCWFILQLGFFFLSSTSLRLHFVYHVYWFFRVDHVFLILVYMFPSIAQDSDSKQLFFPFVISFCISA